MASTKRALAVNAIVDTKALHQYNTTNFVEYASFEQQAASNKRQAPSDSSNKQQASSFEQQASSDKPRATSSSIL
jgi:hypothetical protein